MVFETPTAAMMNTLAGHYLSPSALNSYMDCSLQFYFNYVAGIKESPELQEDVDPALFGTLLHETVRIIYASLENPVERDHIKEVLESTDGIREAIYEAFRKAYFGNTSENPEGRNRVISEIILSYVVRILEQVYLSHLLAYLRGFYRTCGTNR